MSSGKFLTLYSLTSVSIFSILFPIMFLVVLTRRIHLKIKASLVDDHFLYSHDDPAVLLVTLRV